MRIVIDLKKIKYMKLFLILTSVAFLFTTAPVQKKDVFKQKTILVIFPHSDDETAIGEILARYAPANKIPIDFYRKSSQRYDYTCQTERRNMFLRKTWN